MPEPASSNDRTSSTGRKRTEGRQNAVVHEGAPPDEGYDGNERADDRVEIVEPDSSPSPRAEEQR